MGWFTRQQRLKSLLGAGNQAFAGSENVGKLCFQVVVCYLPPESTDPDDFAVLCEKYGINEDEIRIMQEFEVDYHQLEFSLGYVYIEHDGAKTSTEPKLEVVFTSVDKTILNAVLTNSYPPDKNPILDTVFDMYVPEIQRNFKEFVPMQARYSGIGNDAAIMFQFIVHEYQPDLVGVEDMDVLKPITIIDGVTINATADRLDLSFIQKPRSFSYKSALNKHAI